MCYSHLSWVCCIVSIFSSLRPVSLSLCLSLSLSPSPSLPLSLPPHVSEYVPLRPHAPVVNFVHTRGDPVWPLKWSLVSGRLWYSPGRAKIPISFSRLYAHDELIILVEVFVICSTSPKSQPL